MEKEAFLQLLSDQSELAIIGPMPFDDDISVETPILYVDGGINHKRSKEHLHFSVGDGDSAHDPKLINERLPTNKDYTDLEYALSIVPQNISIITLYGFMGGRIDHALGVLGSVSHFLDKNPTCVVLLEKVFMAHPAGHFYFEHNGTFSVLSLYEQHVSISGDCEFSLSDVEKIRPMQGLGLSNKAFGTVKISCQRPLFIYTHFE